jgi:hypothetical protein
VRTEQDRDRGIERWLGRHADTPAPSGACLDPDTIAAWADGTLTRDERQRAESHAADCARCQAVLAAMIQTEPPVSTRATWRSRWPWLVPIAAGATAIALWVSVGTDVPRSPAAPEAKEQAAASRLQEPPSTSAPALPPPPAQDRAAAPPQQKTAPAPPPRLEAARPQGQSTSATDQAAAAPAERRKAEQTFAAPQRFADVAWTEIRSPDPDVRIRFTATGRVERSTDAGATWTPQPIEPAVRLAGGSAPSADVCWLVGSAGTVLRSVDGARWIRLPFPEAIDLVSVSATGANTAIVVTRDGRRFETRDGGQTWSAPRLQENPDPAF